MKGNRILQNQDWSCNDRRFEEIQQNINKLFTRNRVCERNEEQRRA